MRKVYLFLFLLTIIGCNTKSTVEPETYTLLYQKPGLLDSLIGTCSTFLIRTIILDTVNTIDHQKLQINLNAQTDGDLSSVEMFYYKGDSTKTLFVLSGINQINNTSAVTTFSPQSNTQIYLRLKLYSSVCTGQLYSLSVRNVVIKGIK
ncbi:MAG: hypothetical protein ACP5P3_01575 [Ignavibacteria bacterium]